MHQSFVFRFRKGGGPVGQSLQIHLEKEEAQARFGNKISYDAECTDKVECTYENVAAVLQGVSDCNVGRPTGEFLTACDKNTSIRCSIHSSAITHFAVTVQGLLYPLEEGLVFVPNHPVFIKYEKISRIEIQGIGNKKKYDKRYHGLTPSDFHLCITTGMMTISILSRKIMSFSFLSSGTRYFEIFSLCTFWRRYSEHLSSHKQKCL